MRFSIYKCLLRLAAAFLLTQASPSLHRTRHHRMMSDSAASLNSVVVDDGDAGNCTDCRRQMEEAMRLRRQQIHVDILSKLGLDHVPRVVVPKLPPLGKTNDLVQHLLRADNAAVQADDPRGAADATRRPGAPARTVQKVYTLATSPPPSLNFSASLETAFFEFSPDTVRSELRHAVLYVYVESPTRHPVSHTLPVELKVEVFARTRKGKIVEKPLISRKIRHRFYGKMAHWIHVPFLGPVQDWFTAIRNGKPVNHGALIRVTFKGENLASHPTVGSPSDEKSPYLELYVREGADSGRSRRALQLDCDAESRERRCCRYPMLIDFDVFQWDFVIAPRRYNAHVCYGECPKNWQQQYPHTHMLHEHSGAQRVLSAVRAAEDAAPTLPVANQSRPCCHPTEYGAITMVYMNEQKEILVAKVPGMIATRCGCA